MYQNKQLNSALLAFAIKGNDTPFMQEDGKTYLRFDMISVRNQSSLPGPFKKMKGIDPLYFEFVLSWRGEEIYTIPVNTPVMFKSGDTLALNNIEGRAEVTIHD